MRLAQRAIELEISEDLPESEYLKLVEMADEALDSIDFAAIVRQKLEEVGVDALGVSIGVYD